MQTFFLSAAQREFQCANSASSSGLAIPRSRASSPAKIGPMYRRIHMLNPLVVRQQIENLKLVYPALLEDDEAWLASLESETKFEELLTQVVRRIEDTK